MVMEGKHHTLYAGDSGRNSLIIFNQKDTQRVVPLGFKPSQAAIMVGSTRLCISDRMKSELHIFSIEGELRLAPVLVSKVTLPEKICSILVLNDMLLRCAFESRTVNAPISIIADVNCSSCSIVNTKTAPEK